MQQTPLHDIIVSVVSGGVGFIAGFLTKSLMVKKLDDKYSQTFVLIAVTVMWVISVAVDVVSPEYQTSPLVHGLMGAIVGFYYKPTILKGEKNDFSSK